ncbi:DMT family transporter [Deinococcus metallilatus]|uniref:Drug/metabolite transporter (DMT)-like permease n=1 Tax=Deinococcus metallilatus TaxID=1211322 RepID=A0AAJ5JXM1_9DEIO|nr:EamA family transporter [Deinococcus metallilatus]MBB5296548.1 drug/metabolite transporter (DMT)-like permease [Deinococcus metallilatus]QBY08424.1 DMT family transporter [Deinococcus metallilatus]RXJ11223.1 DMT family transporter [Deinococcus metallilatus]TLK24714.1 EamA/RhaT family transporter [Deinococcus metallilatus]GMA17466.1 ABC transporter permease [Deinococcus metallilatus]
MTRQDLLQMLLLSALWGVSFLLIRLAGEAFPPLWVALLRSVFGVLVLGLALRLGGHALPPLRLWKPLLLVALLNNVVPWTFFAWGEQTVSSNIAAVLNATTPLFSLLIGLGLRDAHLGTRLLLGVLLGFGGVGLTVLGGVHGGHATLFGVLVIAAASLSYAAATAIAKRTLGGLNPIGLATSQLGLSALMLFPLALLGAPPAQVSLTAWAAVLVLGVFGSGLAYLLYYGLLARISATQVVAVTYVLPVWGLFWAAVAGERPSVVSGVGVVVVLAGLLLMNAPSRRPQPTPA